jgi:ribonuclease HII
MQYICGIDEAGRGPIAGPVCAAAVILPEDFPFEVLNDSKKMTLNQRLRAELLVKQKAIAWSVAWACRKEIDEVNILQATMNAMQRSYGKIERLGFTATLVLVDGNRVPRLPVDCKAVVKGDSKVREIMAASILAKTARDRLMETLAKKYPQWGYDKHKGYPTAAHRQACRIHGPSPIQRLTFNCD